jgi:hypothetical protein
MIQPNPPTAPRCPSMTKKVGWRRRGGGLSVACGWPGRAMAGGAAGGCSIGLGAARMGRPGTGVGPIIDHWLAHDQAHT